MKGWIHALVVSGSSSLVTMIAGAIVTKILALVAGPSGLTTFSQLRQLGQWLIVLATLSGYNSIVRGIASRELQGRRRFVLVTFSLFLGGAAVAGTMIIVAAERIAALLFSGASQQLVVAVRMIAVMVALGTIASYVLATLNGLGKLRALGLVQGVSALAVVPVAYSIASNGAPVAYVVLGSVGYFVTVIVGFLALRRTELIRGFRDRRGKAGISTGIIREHLQLSASHLGAGLVGTGSIIYIRALYIHEGGLDSGGIFDAAWTISTTYVMLLLTSFGTYYLPNLSSKREAGEISACVIEALKLGILLGAPLVVLVVVVRPTLITLLYSDRFLAASDILRWMFLADYLKISGWVFGMLLIAFAKSKKFLLSEIISSAGLLLGVIWTIDRTPEAIGFSSVGVTSTYLAWVYFRAKDDFGVRIPKSVFLMWATGLVYVGISTYVFWNATSRDLISGISWWIGTAAVFLGIGLKVFRLSWKD